MESPGGRFFLNAPFPVKRIAHRSSGFQSAQQVWRMYTICIQKEGLEEGCDQLRPPGLATVRLEKLGCCFTSKQRHRKSMKSVATQVHKKAHRLQRAIATINRLGNCAVADSNNANDVLWSRLNTMRFQVLADPPGPLCKKSPQRLGHWLCRCPRLDATMEASSITLKVPTTDPNGC